MPVILLSRGRKYLQREKERRMAARTLPTSVRGRTVIFGGGFSTAAFCATFREMGKAPPVVFEQNVALGGMFAQLLPFELNSQNNASIASIVSPGPSRVVPTSDLDDLNWIPNSPHQVRQFGAYEYPRSSDMATAISRTIKDYAEVYTGVDGLTFTRSGQVRMRSDGTSLGTAKRIIWAAGTIPRNDYLTGPAVMSGYKFMQSPPKELHDRRIALVGSGDTAAQCVVYMLGQGLSAPATPAPEIHWYGGLNMPTSKRTWAEVYHAKFNGLARHFPQEFITERSVIRPYAEPGKVISLGRTAMVNGQIFDLVIMATGFLPAPCPVLTSESYRVGGMTVASCNSDETIDGVPTVFKIGTAAGITPSFTPYTSRFPAAKFAMYNQGPMIAALAASLTD